MILTIWTKENMVQVCQLSDDPADGTSEEQIDRIGGLGFAGWACVNKDYKGQFPNTDPSLWYWNGSAIASKTEIPQVVTRRQARRALLQEGLLSQVDAAIDAISDESKREAMRIDWQDASEYRRDDETLLSLAAALNLSNDALDQLFVQASQY